MIKLYGRGQSRSFRAVWALNEAQIPFDYVEVEDGMSDSPEYRALNSQGKVPTLTDGRLTLTESAAMVNYAAASGAGDLLPADPVTRARVDELCYFVMADLEQPLWTIGKHRFALPEEQRLEAVMPTAIWEFDKSQKALMTHLGDAPFAVGDQFSVADILVAHTLNWAIRFEMNVAPELVAYRDRHYERPACVDSLALVVPA